MKENERGRVLADIVNIKDFMKQLATVEWYKKPIIAALVQNFNPAELVGDDILLNRGGENDDHHTFSRQI